MQPQATFRREPTPLTLDEIRDIAKRLGERDGEAVVYVTVAEMMDMLATLDDFSAALAEIERLRLATSEGSLARRADRMWEIACEMRGEPVPGAKPFRAALASCDARPNEPA